MKNGSNIEEHLLLQYLLRQTSAEDNTRIEAWLMENKGNRLLLDRLETLWAEAGKLTPSPVAVDTDAAWQRFSALIDRQEKGDSRPIARFPVTMHYLRYAMVAAAVLVLLIGIFAVYRFAAKPAQQLEMVAGMTLLTDTLPDGSPVALRAGSRLTFPDQFDKRFREVRLTGEAFFKVRPDRDQPFIVVAGKAIIRVVGTAFDVKAFPGRDITVAVEEGMVQLFTIDPVSGDTASILLEEGMKGYLPAGKMIPVRIDSHNPDELFWLDHQLVFRETDLALVIDILERNYKVRIRVSDPRINHCRLTATFTDEPIDRIMNVVAASFNLELNIENRNYLLQGTGCSRENQ